MTKNSKSDQQTGVQGGAAVPQLVELAQLDGAEPTGPALLDGKLRLLDSVPVSLNVVLGAAHTTVGELMALQEASLLKIDRLADQPIDVMLNGNIVARGQLVVVDNNFGVRITELAQASQS